jgi:hypothetical protein
MKPTTKVIDVNGSPIIGGKPALRNPDFVSGLLDRTAARNWGEKHGYAIVYYWPSRNRAYAEKKPQANVAMLERIIDAVESL